LIISFTNDGLYCARKMSLDKGARYSILTRLEILSKGRIKVSSTMLSFPVLKNELQFHRAYSITIITKRQGLFQSWEKGIPFFHFKAPIHFGIGFYYQLPEYLLGTGRNHRMKHPGNIGQYSRDVA